MIEGMLALSGPEQPPTPSEAQNFCNLLRANLPRADFIDTLDLKLIFADIAAPAHPTWPAARDFLSQPHAFDTNPQNWSAAELENFLKAAHVRYAFGVKDRFSDFGLSGCILVAGDVIERFALGDSLLNLDIERTALSHVEKQMRKKGVEKIQARFAAATPASQKLYVQSGFIRADDLWVKPL